MVLLAISAIISSIATSIVLFIQSLSLSTCRQIQCCDTTCELAPAWFTDQPKPEPPPPDVNSPRPRLSVKDL